MQGSGVSLSSSIVAYILVLSSLTSENEIPFRNLVVTKEARKFTSGDLTSRHVYRMLREFVDFANAFH